jgi:hypothetical protein
MVMPVKPFLHQKRLTVACMSPTLEGLGARRIIIREFNRQS